MSEQIEWITIAKAAKIMDMHIESVRRLCRKGDKSPIRCRQLFKSAPWEVVKADAEKYEKPVGRPPTSN